MMNDTAVDALIKLLDEDGSVVDEVVGVMIEF